MRLPLAERLPTFDVLKGIPAWSLPDDKPIHVPTMDDCASRARTGELNIPENFKLVPSGTNCPSRWSISRISIVQGEAERRFVPIAWEPLKTTKPFGVRWPVAVIPFNAVVGFETPGPGASVIGVNTSEPSTGSNCLAFSRKITMS